MTYPKTLMVLGDTTFSEPTTYKFYMWLDADVAGRKAAKKLGNRLELYGEVCYISTKQDPKCYSDEQIKKIIEYANINKTYKE